jgi:hypothetical protein
MLSFKRRVGAGYLRMLALAYDSVVTSVEMMISRRGATWGYTKSH